MRKLNWFLSVLLVVCLLTGLFPAAAEGSDNPVLPGVTVYNVVVDKNITGGRVSVSSTSATKGTIVTVLVTPNKDYELEKLTVTDSEGNAISLIDRRDGSYAFSMPASSVSITATFKSTVAVWENPFEDVEEGTWYFDAISYVAQIGMMNGYDSDTFGINDSLTRAQLTQVLYNLEGRPEVTGKNEFSDVEDTIWYAKAVNWAAKNGLVSGYGNGKFGPEDPVTREQMATILYRYIQSKGGGFSENWTYTPNFPDRGDISSWAYEPVCWMVKSGIMNGMGDGTLKPGGTATRAQVATILFRFCERLPK